MLKGQLSYIFKQHSDGPAYAAILKEIASLIEASNTEPWAVLRKGNREEHPLKAYEGAEVCIGDALKHLTAQFPALDPEELKQQLVIAAWVIADASAAGIEA